MKSKTLNTTKERGNTKRKRSRGFTLLEVITAIFILTVGAGASFALIQQTLLASSLIEFKLIASYLAQEGIEIVRNIRDTNWLQEQRNTEPAKSSPWDDGLCDLPPTCTWQADYTTATFEPTDFEGCADINHYNCNIYSDSSLLYVDGNTGFYRYLAAPGPNDTQTIFKRKISITPIDADRIQVLVEVEWEERGRSHNFKALEYITNWY